MTDRSPGSAGRYQIRSVTHALRTLELLAELPDGRGLGVTEIATATGLSKSAAFAVLQTLLDHGYVADIGAGQRRRYRLGRGLTRLGDLARAQLPLRELARPTLRRLADELRLSVRLGLLQDKEIAVVDRVDGHGGLRIDLQMGDHELLHTSALGKAILATRSPADARRILGHRRLARRTSRSITARTALATHLDLVRDRGYAVDDEEDSVGIVCIGAAIREHTDASNAAISVTMIKAHLTDERLRAIAAALMAGAAEVAELVATSRQPTTSLPTSRPELRPGSF